MAQIVRFGFLQECRLVIVIVMVIVIVIVIVILIVIEEPPFDNIEELHWA